MPPKRKFSESVPNVGRSFKRSKPTAKDRSRGLARVTTVVRAPGPIPPRMIVKMKYSEAYTSDGVTMDHLWNLNSVFDPNRTGTGHQPYGHDTYISLYNRYRVFAVRYLITISGTGTGYGMIGWDNATTTRTNASLWQETPKSRVKLWTPTQPAIFTGRISLPSITGVTHATYKADDRYQSQQGQDPAENLILHTGIANADNSTVAASAAFVKVQLEYYVEWFDQFTLAQS